MQTARKRYFLWSMSLLLPIYEFMNCAQVIFLLMDYDAFRCIVNVVPALFLWRSL